jgi:hypothetical protein
VDRRRTDRTAHTQGSSASKVAQRQIFGRRVCRAETWSYAGRIPVRRGRPPRADMAQRTRRRRSLREEDRPTVRRQARCCAWHRYGGGWPPCIGGRPTRPTPPTDTTPQSRSASADTRVRSAEETPAQGASEPNSAICQRTLCSRPGVIGLPAAKFNSGILARRMRLADEARGTTGTMVTDARTGSRAEQRCTGADARRVESGRIGLPTLGQGP